ncbi:MAG: hypothetical protein JNM99_14880 [Verrucomicrobiaceae bacterium]|nr:hypothetical protein [Verrucomicrobiaceae bacterium]
MSKANEVLAPPVSLSSDRLPTPDQGVVQSGGKFQANRGKPPSSEIPSAEAMKEVARSYIKEVGPNELRVGEVRLLKRERTITFTATVAVRTQPLEYALVHETGKAHEALLVTKVPVQDVHVAVLLLEASGRAPMIEVSWRKHGGEARMPLSDLIRVQQVAPDVLKANPWTYNGSEFSHGSFAAMREGSLVALVNDPAALVNHRTAASLMRDDVFFANSDKLPPDGVPVSVIFVFTGNK